MNIKTFGCVAALALCVPASAEATILTFDDLVSPPGGWYGDGLPLLPSMSATAHSLIYVSQGYQLTYFTPNADPFKSHIGDGSRPEKTFNWHTGFDNAAGGYVELARIGGGAFDLIGFDYDVDDLVVTGGALNIHLSGAGAFSLPISGVNSVVFTPTAEFLNSGLDNIEVATPEPSTWALLLAGFAALGALRQRGRNRLQRAVARTPSK